jgi:hypothetical protein
MRPLSPNHLQAQSIRRYHTRLLKHGRRVTLEEAGREWIGRFARMWRDHHSNRPVIGSRLRGRSLSPAI